MLLSVSFYLFLLAISCFLPTNASGPFLCPNPTQYITDPPKWFDYPGCKTTKEDYCKECVALVRHACGGLKALSAKACWVRGIQVKGNADKIANYTAIATFTAPNGGYRGHAAIYLSQDNVGINVCTNVILKI